jgi:4a-hydroxytetrahydrobiopterin dehydratase
LSKDQIVEALKDLKNMELWKVNPEGNKISKSYTARNFQSALDSINAIGLIAERQGHHPDIHLTEYRNVEIVLFTRSLGGVTANDILVARMIEDEVNVDYSPKWFKSRIEKRNE